MLFTVKTYSSIPPLAEEFWENCNICRNYDEIKSVSFFWNHPVNSLALANMGQ